MSLLRQTSLSFRQSSGGNKKLICERPLPNLADSRDGSHGLGKQADVPDGTSGDSLSRGVLSPLGLDEMRQSLPSDLAGAPPNARGSDTDEEEDDDDDGFRVFLSQTHKPLPIRGATPVSNGSAPVTARGGPTNFAGAFSQEAARATAGSRGPHTGGGGGALTSPMTAANPAGRATTTAAAAASFTGGAIACSQTFADGFAMFGIHGLGRQPSSEMGAHRAPPTSTGNFRQAQEDLRMDDSVSCAPPAGPPPLHQKVRPGTAAAPLATSFAASTSARNIKNFPNFLRVVDATNTNPFLPLKSRKHGRAGSRRPLKISGNATISRYVKNFEELSVIGAGSFSDVYRCRSRVDGCTYAIKRRRERVHLRNGGFNADGAPTAARTNEMKEVHAMAALGASPHIVRYFSAWREDDHLYIQTEIAWGSLEDAVLGRRPGPNGSRVFTPVPERSMALLLSGSNGCSTPSEAAAAQSGSGGISGAAAQSPFSPSLSTTMSAAAGAAAAAAAASADPFSGAAAMFSAAASLAATSAAASPDSALRNGEPSFSAAAAIAAAGGASAASSSHYFPASAAPPAVGTKGKSRTRSRLRAESAPSDDNDDEEVAPSGVRTLSAAFGAGARSQRNGMPAADTGDHHNDIAARSRAYSSDSSVIIIRDDDEDDGPTIPAAAVFPTATVALLPALSRAGSLLSSTAAAATAAVLPARPLGPGPLQPLFAAPAEMPTTPLIVLPTLPMSQQPMSLAFASSSSFALHAVASWTQESVASGAGAGGRRAVGANAGAGVGALLLAGRTSTAPAAAGAAVVGHKRVRQISLMSAFKAPLASAAASTAAAAAAAMFSRGSAGLGATALSSVTSSSSSAAHAGRSLDDDESDYAVAVGGLPAPPAAQRQRMMDPSRQAGRAYAVSFEESAALPSLGYAAPATARHSAAINAVSTPLVRPTTGAATSAASEGVHPPSSAAAGAFESADDYKLNARSLASSGRRSSGGYDSMQGDTYLGFSQLQSQADDFLGADNNFSQEQQAGAPDSENSARAGWASSAGRRRGGPSFSSQQPHRSSGDNDGAEEEAGGDVTAAARGGGAARRGMLFASQQACDEDAPAAAAAAATTARARGVAAAAAAGEDSSSCPALGLLHRASSYASSASIPSNDGSSDPSSSRGGLEGILPLPSFNFHHGGGSSRGGLECEDQDLSRGRAAAEARLRPSAAGAAANAMDQSEWGDEGFFGNDCNSQTSVFSVAPRRRARGGSATSPHGNNGSNCGNADFDVGSAGRIPRGGALGSPNNAYHGGAPAAPKPRARLAAADLLLVCRHTASGLAYMHAHGVAHLDVKPSNILVSYASGPGMADAEGEWLPEVTALTGLPTLDAEALAGARRAAAEGAASAPTAAPAAPASSAAGSASSSTAATPALNLARMERLFPVTYKLGDLGQVAALGSRNVEEGDSRYLSRELLNGDTTNLPAADVYALGLTLLELATGTPLPTGEDAYQTLRDGILPLEGLGELPVGFVQLMVDMVRPDARTRPSAQSIVAHPLVAGLIFNAHGTPMLNETGVPKAMVMSLAAAAAAAEAGAPTPARPGSAEHTSQLQLHAAHSAPPAVAAAPVVAHHDVGGGGGGIQLPAAEASLLLRLVGALERACAPASAAAVSSSSAARSGVAAHSSSSSSSELLLSPILDTSTARGGGTHEGMVRFQFDEAAGGHPHPSNRTLSETLISGLGRQSSSSGSGDSTLLHNYSTTSDREEDISARSLASSSNVSVLAAPVDNDEMAVDSSSPAVGDGNNAARGRQSLFPAAVAAACETDSESRVLGALTPYPRHAEYSRVGAPAAQQQQVKGPFLGSLLLGKNSGGAGGGIALDGAAAAALLALLQHVRASVV